jgi:hypothetical protein
MTPPAIRMVESTSAAVSILAAPANAVSGSKQPTPRSFLDSND